MTWDGWQEAEELVAGDYGAMVPQRQFVWGEQLDELVAYRYQAPGGGWAEYYVAEGGAHCPQRVLDSSGQVVEIQEYDPYGKTSFFDGAGNPVGSWSQVGNPFGWKAVRIDPETGLLYMRHRYYSPQWGRFLTQDPLGVWGDDLGIGNDYAYGAANPLVMGDPFGLQVWRQAAEQLGVAPGSSAMFSAPLRMPYSDTPFFGVKVYSDGFVTPLDSDGRGLLVKDYRDAMDSPWLYEAQKKLFHVLNGASFGVAGLLTETPESESIADTALEYAVPIAAAGKALVGAGRFLRGAWQARRAAQRTAQEAAKKKAAEEAAEEAARKVLPCENAANGGGTVTQTRQTLGRDGATSSITRQTDGAGRTISQTHTITKDGQVIHQHREHIGKYGGERRFPDEWTGTPTINTPPHTPKLPGFPRGSN